MLRLTGLLLSLVIISTGCDNKQEITPEQQAAKIQGKLKDANTRLRNNRAKDASEIFLWILKEEPSNAGALRGMAEVRIEEKKYAEAEKLAGEAVAADPNNAEAQGTLGHARSKNGNHIEAAAAYSEAFRLDPENALMGYSQGNSLLRAKKYAEAEAAYRATAKADNEVKYVWSKLGDSLREQDKLDDALKSYMKSLTLYKSDRAAHAGAALIYEKKQDTRRAVDHWSTYVRMDCCSPYAKDVAKPTLERLRLQENKELDVQAEKEKAAPAAEGDKVGNG